MTLCLRILPVLIFWLLTQSPAFCQLSAPEAEAVYGGKISAITGISTSTNTSRIFITTESAHAAFYMDVDHSGSHPVFGRFQILESMGAASGFEVGIQQIDAHEASGHFFFIHQGFLYHTDPASTSVQSVDGAGVESLLIEGEYLFYVKGGALYFGMLDTKGKFTAGVGAPIPLPPGVNRTILRIHPTNHRLYIFGQGSSPLLYITDSLYSSLSARTRLADYAPLSLTGLAEWRAFGIAPDGRLFMSGTDLNEKMIAYADNDSVWTHERSGFVGVTESNLSFGGDSSDYVVYDGGTYNSSKGASGAWNTFGKMGHETHP
ncbi:MAG: hypothetical protein AAFR59_16735, partial [Bacteroidota bacterium]